MHEAPLAPAPKGRYLWVSFAAYNHSTQDSLCIDCMPDLTHAKIVDMIRTIQSGNGGWAEFNALAFAMRNPDIRVIFDAFELEGMAPEKIYDLFCG